MSILWEKSAGWRWLVRRTRDSKPFFFTFAALCGVVPGVIGYGVMQLTGSRNEQLEAHLRSTARPETTMFTFVTIPWSPPTDETRGKQMMGQVNRERLAEFLGELQRKEDTNDRYVAALRGETLTRKRYERIQPLPAANAQASQETAGASAEEERPKAK
ncbi:hypothetical protein Zm00014a_009305 [Zea mays]|uniref:Uncharacterized protein n=2 Tax=Zea mays TaxID=4577 RepID=A0A3L6EMD5_MAIZE|nr:uncharacterized protein LOC100276303 isoform X1 [Zea mays]AQK71089.1 hypothetical protein ZEAMMB73_Zm00001d016519 [Zea mays]PWZ22254.1 hypothetical protein Zm00014a_009305 [Zea mays]|eukprot:XP_020408811.1 uncharacterized protein LOC100276303 isoform X1 [Zea mays]